MARSLSAGFGRSPFDDRPTSSRSPWQNAYAERLISAQSRGNASIMSSSSANAICTTFHCRRKHYNATRTHLSLNKDTPVPRGVEWAGTIVCRPILGGLRHQYGRMIYGRHSTTVPCSGPTPARFPGRFVAGRTFNDLGVLFPSTPTRITP
jgi:hypothetical protein